MKKIIFFLSCLPLMAVAQQKDKINYYASYQFGMTVGKAYTTINAQMIQGIRYKNYQAGVGVALDPYGFRTIPVFGHVAYMLHPQKSSPYVYADAGVSIPWNSGVITEKNPATKQEWHKLYSGLYAEAGIGYSIAINKRHAVTFSGGYSYKRFRYTENVQTWDGNVIIQQKDWYIFNYRRLAFRIGFSF